MGTSNLGRSQFFNATADFKESEELLSISKETEKMPSDPWHWWDQFRSNINTEKRVNVVLVLG